LLDLSDLPLLQPIGARPPKPNESTFLLNVLDLASGGALRSFARTLDAGGQFAAPADPNALTLTTASSLVPTIEGANTLPVSSGIATGQPFGPPAKMTTTALPEASPVIVAFASSPAKLLYALRANPEWNLGTAFVPLLGNGHVPYLVRGPTGPAGLLLAAPPGAVLAPAVPAASARPAGTRRASIGVFALIGLAIVGGGAAAAVVSRRRNPRFGR
jgi:hypothetical protein